MTATHAANGTIDAGGQGITLIRRLVVINLGLVAIQALSAGFFMSGYGRAVTVHTVVALALQVGAFVQAATAVVLWRRRRVPGWVAGLSIGLFVIVFLQVGFGYSRRYWLHVPIGVGLFGGLMRQMSRLDTLRRTIGARS
jgi:Na+/proline symporter